MYRGLKQDEYDWLQRLYRAVDECWGDLSEWERRFMENRIEAFRRYGMKTRISRRQWDIIARISEKIL